MAPTSQGESTTMGAVMPSTVGSSGLNLAAINLDPSLLALATGTSSTPLDPALFTIEQVVNDVREGRIGPDDLRDETKPADHTEEGVSEPVIEEEPHPHTHAQPEPEPEPETELQLDDDGIDPALREIVNSLTNAQQVSFAFHGYELTFSHIQLHPAMSARLSTESAFSTRCSLPSRTSLRATLGPTVPSSTRTSPSRLIISCYRSKSQSRSPLYP